MPPPPLSGTNVCSTAIALSGINCVAQEVSDPNELWFSFTASAAVHQFIITQDLAYDVWIEKFEIDSGTCASLVVLDSITLTQDSGNIDRIVSGFTSGRTYYMKLKYFANSVSTADLKVCMQTPQAACPANGCEWINEAFSYTPSTTFSISPFGNNQIPCWISATGTPQIMNNTAYMWSELRLANTGCGNLNQRWGEGIARELPTMSANEVYVLDYDLHTASGGTVSNLYVALTPTASAGYPITTSANIMTVPHFVIDQPTNITNTTPTLRRICFQTQNLPAYMNCYLAFWPWSNVTCIRQHIYIDNVKVYHLNSVLQAIPVPCGTQIGPCNNLPAGLVNAVWTPTVGLSNANIPNPVANPTTTTTYTLTMTVNGVTANANTSCGPITGTVTVNPVTSLTVTASASPNPLCSGNTATLSATGANTYTWNPGGLTGSTVTVSPGSTTAYTVTGSAGTCPDASADVTLTVTPTPTISIAAAPYGACNYAAPGTTSICAGASITFTATSGGAISSYTWTPGPITGSMVTVSPTVTTSYTVSGTGSNGCPASNTITVNVSNCTCPGTALPALTNTTITGGNYAVAPSTTVTVTGNVTLSGTDIKMGADAVIQVPNGALLRISGSHLSSCYNMWRGIVVDPGGQLDVSGNSFIEDAKVAIDNNPTNTSQSGTPSIVLINGAVFNCNNTCVRRAFYNSGTTTNYTTSVFSINDAVFTCRCNLPSPITTTALTIYSNTVTGTPSLTAPDLSDFFSVSNYTQANLKPPLAGLPPLDGVELENVGVAQTTTLAPLPYINNVGGATLVLFDNMKFGVNATNATFSVTNTAYQTYRTTSTGAKNTVITGGYAINAVCNVPDWYNGTYVDNSRFIHWFRGIHSVNYYEVDINNNTIFSRTSKTTFGIQALGPQPGDYGFYASSTRFREVKLNNNRLANLASGIVFSVAATSNFYNGGNGQYIGPVTVGSNTLTAQFPGNNYTNKYIGTAIAISNVLTPSASSTATPGGSVGAFIYARANTISDAYNGIYQGNHQWHKVRTEQNTVALQYHPTATLEVNQYGIQHANCFYGSGTSGYGNDIYDNTVTGYFASTYTFNSSNQSTFEKKKGIWSRSCGNHYVTCNDVYHNGRGFEWEGVHTGSTTYWAKNTMNHNGEGHCLINNGTIGTQSTSTNNANDNQWLSTANTYADTWVDGNSTAANSILWVQTNTLSFGPINNLFAGTGIPYSYTPAYLVQPKGICGYACSPPPTSRMGNQSSGDSNTREGESIEGVDVAYLEDVVLDSIQYPSYQSENSFINRLSVYQMLKRDNSLLSNSTLSTFYTSNASTSLGKFTQIEDSLYTGNLSYANMLLSSVVPATSVESSYIRFYQLYIASMTGQLSPSDSSDLYSLASSCPMLNGVIVFQARALRNSLIQGFENYEDNCPQGSNVQKFIGRGNSGQSLLVYPNPTTGELKLINLNCADKMVLIEITDVAGKIVATKQVQCNNGVGHFNLDLNNGVYFIKAIGADHVERSGKMIISK